MILHIRNGSSMFEVRVPEGSLVQFSAAGRPILVIPGPTPHDTAAWLPAGKIVEAARVGMFNLQVIAEKHTTDARPKVDRRAAG